MERNIFNLTIYHLLDNTQGGDVNIQPWFRDWLNANMSGYELRWVDVVGKSRSRRLGLFLSDPGDQMLFLTRWTGQFDEPDSEWGRHYLGPFTMEEMTARHAPGRQPRVEEPD